jgi:hypothetical protein
VGIADSARGAGHDGDSATGDSSTVYVRTETHPSSPSSGAMYVLACAAAAPTALPDTDHGCRTGRGPGAQGYLAFGDSVWTDSAGRRARTRSADIALGDSTFRHRHRRISMEHVRATSGDRRFLSGQFTEWPDGRVTFSQLRRSAVAPTIRVVAERASAVTLRSTEPR